MNRKELYNEVKRLGIAGAIQDKFGINYTNLNNITLASFIKGFKNKKKETKVTAKATDNARVAVIKLISILQTKKILTAKEAEEVAKTL